MKSWLSSQYTVGKTSNQQFTMMNTRPGVHCQVTPAQSRCPQPGPRRRGQGGHGYWSGGDHPPGGPPRPTQFTSTPNAANNSIMETSLLQPLGNQQKVQHDTAQALSCCRFQQLGGMTRFWLIFPCLVGMSPSSLTGF